MILIKNIFKKRYGKIKISDEKIDLYIENEIISKENLEELRKDLKKVFRTDIYLEKSCYKEMEIPVDEDIEDKDIEKLIGYEVRNSFEIEDIDIFFIKFFKEEENYKIFLIDRDFLESTIQFFLKNSFKVEKIVIESEKDYFINDYDTLLKSKSYEAFKRENIFFILFIFTVFLFIKIYNFNLKSKIGDLEEKIYIEEQRINNLKEEYNELSEKLKEKEIEIKNLSYKKEYFEDKILKVINMIPDDIYILNLYYEKGFLNIKGVSHTKQSLFKFLDCLEKDKDIKESRFDYIIKKEKLFEFYIEIKV